MSLIGILAILGDGKVMKVHLCRYILIFSEWKTAFYPFGVGPHACIGRMFATLFLKSFWSRILTQCNIELVEKKVPEMDASKIAGARLPPNQVLAIVRERE
jgi:cytochrome P450